jgi:hypothetical protein
VDSKKICIDNIEKSGLTKSYSLGKLDVYRLDDHYFLPHFYIPKNTIISKRTDDELPRILSQDDYKIRSAIFFENENINNSEILKRVRDNNNRNEALPTLEFKKINPTKYQVRVHGASGAFPLVFSESFHKEWKAYLTKIRNPQSNIQNLDSYRILDGNEEDQANKGELVDYIKNRWISTLGSNKDGEIDYISRNFQGTIQNDNLPDGNIFETWLKKPIDNNRNHLMVNGYANSWIIDSKNLCGNNNLCVKNADGTYDLEMIVEFWPQRLFYVGLSISLVTFLASIGYLLYNYKKKVRE